MYASSSGNREISKFPSCYRHHFDAVEHDVFLSDVYLKYRHSVQDMEVKCFAVSDDQLCTYNLAEEKLVEGKKLNNWMQTLMTGARNTWAVLAKVSMAWSPHTWSFWGLSFGLFSTSTLAHSFSVMASFSPPCQVEHVLLYDFPRDPIEYMRRVGRTARAGRKGIVTVLAWGRQVRKEPLFSQVRKFPNLVRLWVRCCNALQIRAQTGV